MTYFLFILALVGAGAAFWYAVERAVVYDRWAFFLFGGCWALLLVLAGIGQLTK